MKGIELVNCEIGTVSSMKDHSVKFVVYTGELRPSEKGIVMDYHGAACRVTVMPHDTPPEETVVVDAPRDAKTPSQQLRGVLYRLWEYEGKQGDFNLDYYPRQMGKIVEHYKGKLPI